MPTSSCRMLPCVWPSAIQPTTDGLKSYRVAVDGAFGADIGYAHFGETLRRHARHGWAIQLGRMHWVKMTRIEGRPEKNHVSTSYVERQNLNFRMGMRRFTRLTNGLSKKVEPLSLMVCLYTEFHKFVRIHTTLRCPTAMAAGLTGKLWDMNDHVAMIDVKAEARQKRSAYKPHQPKAAGRVQECVRAGLGL